MGFWQDEDRKPASPSPEKEWRWAENEEFSSELVQDHIRRCYDREER